MTDFDKALEQFAENFTLAKQDKDLERMRFWMNRAKQAIEKHIIGENELGKWRGKARMTNRAAHKNVLRAEQRKALYGDSK